ncbi:DUF4870 domain-containing protein [Actinoplanes solisilvae]|uniref:DUF4870 domain-containing protein n=1 Tax=Actinoplanes solisilvae TaxID=2486853 RepID=UPI000FDA5757|nr:DUF4870 domain-containing protein [Actinoplanes solisilvae]
MTEPPRPPGDPDPNDPTRPFDPYAPNDPAPGSAPPPPPPYKGSPGYGYQGPPPGYRPGPSQDDKTWVLIAHFGGAVGALVGGGLAGWVPPLIALLAKGPQSPAVRAESIKALNFQIVWAVVGLIGWATVCIGIGLVIIPIATLVAIIFGIVAGVKASNNEPYNYPMTVNLIK